VLNRNHYLSSDKGVVRQPLSPVGGGDFSNQMGISYIQTIKLLHVKYLS
jgi:hypothetical protein